jgi:hypothetical protein
MDYGTITPYYASAAAFSSNLNFFAQARNVTVSANVEIWYSF